MTIAHVRFGPVAVEWEEPPFTWESPYRVAVERCFRGGPFLRFLSDVHVVADGDHSFKVPKRGPVPQPQVFARVQDEVAGWLRGLG